MTEGHLRGIFFLNRNGLRWRDAPEEYAPHKAQYNRWKRWRRAAERHRFERGRERGLFTQMIVGLAAGHGEEKILMIYATYLKAHRSATSMAAKQGGADA